jgi:acyl-CoA thioesterase FadM
MLTEGVFVFTAKLDIRYRRQAEVGANFSLIGRVKERRDKRLSIEARLEANDVVIAESTGLFVVAKRLSDLR